MERLSGVLMWCAIIVVVILLALLTTAKLGNEARASEEVYVSAYCLERHSIEALLVADRKGPRSIKAARRGLFASGACKNLPYLIHGRVVADHGIHKGRRCDWRVVQIQVKAEPLPVWSAAPRNCGPDV